MELNPPMDIVIFDNSGSMGGDPMKAALEHASTRFNPATKWMISDGKALIMGRLGDANAYDRICSYMGPSTFQHAIAAACAPGVRLTVYTDDANAPIPGGEDPFLLLDGRNDRVVLIGVDADWFNEGVVNIAKKHPDIEVEVIMRDAA